MGNTRRSTHQELCGAATVIVAPAERAFSQLLSRIIAWWPWRDGELIEWMPEVDTRIAAISNAYFGFEDDGGVEAE